MTVAANIPTFRRYSDWRKWLRGLVKHSFHSATGAVLSALGTNGVEGMAPEAVRGYVEGIGLTFSQAVAVFGVSLVLAALRYVHEATAPEMSLPPFDK